MKFVANKKRLPLSFARHPAAVNLVAECDITPCPHGRLAAKVLIFDSRKSLKKFWKDAFGHNVGRGCMGVVNALATEVMSIGKDGKENRPKISRGDGRYFCAVGLCQGYLTMEIITHESVHAGFCYERRVRRNMFGEAAKDFDEERIAYPVGGIADAISRFLHSKKLINT